MISTDERSYRFFADLYGILCELTGEGSTISIVLIKHLKKFSLKIKASIKQPRK
jgi:hypothetical protein